MLWLLIGLPLFFVSAISECPAAKRITCESNKQTEMLLLLIGGPQIAALIGWATYRSRRRRHN